MLNPKIKKILNCTASNPKPVEAIDTEEVIWHHHGGRPVDLSVKYGTGDQIPYRCHHCGAEFNCIKGSKIVFNEEWRQQTRDTIKQMRALGWIPEAEC
jgi:hypothetical protein